jgi:1-acyl-sn-glycerol-3-phosphate acyltransferase
MIDGRIAEAGPQERAAVEAIQAMGEQFVEFIRGYYEEVMEKVGELSRIALCEKQLNLIIFPEGTRSVTLAEGRTGLAQLALHTEKRIVPVACNNSEEVYTGSLPFAKSGRITYRIGEPLSVQDRLKEFRIREPFRLFSRESQQRYREQFEGVTRIVMASIEGMLDEKYRRGCSAT